MSKYIKLEDAIHNINLEVTGRKEYTGDMKANLFFALDDLPTIEVSEDCISREWLEEQYWQTLIPKGMVNTDVELGINIGIEKMHAVIKKAPSVVPTVRKNRQVERAEGEWIINEPEESGFGAIYECPYCKYEVEFEPTNYCPNCGAKMKG